MTFLNKKTNNDFLPHLYEPLRRKIAVCFVRHEMRKLLPELRNQSLWKSIDAQIDNWYKELSMRNFWNAVHGISMGFRLKSIVPWITSLNMKWVEKGVSVEELWFGGKFDIIGSLPGSPEAASVVKEMLFRAENKELYLRARKNTEEKSSETASRENDPIFVVRKEGKLRVIDGNRRLMRAIINNKNSIKSFVGEPVAEPHLYEHWVPTQLLVDLVFWHEQQVLVKRDTTEITASTIAELIRGSSAGRIEFRERGIHKDNEAHLRLLEAVAQTLKGI